VKWVAAAEAFYEEANLKHILTAAEVIEFLSSG
jgi:hypothetical protein